jgi:hypothetical protein
MYVYYVFILYRYTYLSSSSGQKLNGNCTVSVTAPDLNFVSDLSSLTINSKEQLAYASVISWSLQTTTGVQTVVNSKSEFVRV